jgi:diaminopimelate decarboxylase
MVHAKEIGHEISVVDIGGGFPFPYKGEKFDFNEFCKPIMQELSTFDKSI